ncbi:MAG: lectin like domain-containing protein [bacterium]|nr:lectin like domain-containing protein [bacterium]
MNKKLTPFYYCIVFLLFAARFTFAENLSFAPLNPEYQKNQNNSGSITTTPLSLPPALYSEAPSSFDLRSYKRVSPVKDQGTAGSCWAFATYASLESYLLSKNESWDFSENHMKNILSSSYAEGFDRKPSDGGNHFMSTAYLVRWSGPISELEDPYNANSTGSPENLKPVKHVQEVIFIPDRKSTTDNNAIKQAVMKYGAIYTTMYFNSAYLAKGKNYYYNGSNVSNHAVSIVGWIDNYSRTNFYGSAAGIPPGDGAFIVKNSWGTLWGESGYFYISYYDSNIGKNCVVFNNAEPADNYNQIYQYDPLGWVTSAGFGNDTAHFANIFTSTQNGLIQAVGFYTPIINSQYEVKIYKNVSDKSPVDGTLAITNSGIIPDPGYHTIKLYSDVAVSKNEKFSAVVKLKTPGYNYPIPMEVPISGYSSNATALPGQSFVSKDGISWADTTSSRSGSNVCIKVYGSIFEIDLVSPNGGEEWQHGSTQKIEWRYGGNLKGQIKIELLRNEKLFYLITSGTSIGKDSTGCYYWKIPSSIPSSNDYKIRITHTTNSSITDSSSEPFSITAGKIVVESPSKGTVFAKGSNQLIQWKSTGNVGNYVKIELLKFGNSIGTITSSVANKNSTGLFTWKIPSNISTDGNYSIKVVSTSNPNIYGISQAFSITGPSIKLTSPDGGETWYTGTTQTISWNYNGNYSKTIKIECVKGHYYSLIAQINTVTGNNSYQWYIPSTMPASDGYKIRLTAIDDISITDTSDGYFTISSGSINLVSPSGGEMWTIGETKNIAWVCNGNPGTSVKIELYKGQKYIGLIGTKSINTQGIAQFTWRIPTELASGSDYRIKVISTSNPGIFAMSEYFSIAQKSTINEANLLNNFNGKNEYPDR